MIDIQALRKDPEGVAKRLATRGPAAFDLDRFQRLESTRKQLQSAVEQTQASHNRIAKDIGTAKAKGQDVAPLLEEAEKLKGLLERSEQQLVVLQRRCRSSSSACRTSRTSRSRWAPRRTTTARSGAGRRETADRASSISR
jgi:seryl-tRNA synthetase